MKTKIGNNYLFPLLIAFLIDCIRTKGTIIVSNTTLVYSSIAKEQVYTFATLDSNIIGCNQASTCSIYSSTPNSANVTFSSNITNLTTPKIYPIRDLNKALLISEESQTLSFSNSSQKAVTKATRPSSFKACYYTEGLKYICESKVSNTTFLYDVRKENVIIAYSSSIADQIRLINNQACALVNGSLSLFCAKLGPKKSLQIMKLENQSAGFIPLKTKFPMPPNATYATSFNEILGIFNNGPSLQVRIANFTDNTVVGQWNATIQDKARLLASMEHGIMVVAQANYIQIHEFKTGKRLKRVTRKSFLIGNANIDLKDGNLYFLNTMGPVTQQKLQRITISRNTTDSCRPYNYGADRCTVCPSSTIKIDGAHCLSQSVLLDKNLTTDYFLPADRYNMKMGYESVDRALLTFNNIQKLSPFEKRLYISSIFGTSSKDPIKSKFVLLHPTNKLFISDDFLTFKPLYYPSLWDRGKALLKIEQRKSYERFDGFLAFTGPDFVQQISEQKVKREGTFKEEELLAPIPSGRILEGLQVGNYKKISVPPHWEPNTDSSTIFLIMYNIIKLLITLLQIFIVFVRPFAKIFNNKWSMWFTSSLIGLQIYLILGIISGNFGGVVDKMLRESLLAFRRTFFFDLTFTGSSQFEALTKSFPINKLESVGYRISPISETPIELLILLIALIFQILSWFIPEINTLAKNFREGATQAFAVPLILSSTSCIILVSFLQVGDFFTFCSFFVSLLVILYYFLDMFLVIFPCRWVKTFYILYDGSFRCYDLDSISHYSSGKLMNFVEFLEALLYPLLVVLLSSSQVFSPIFFLIFFGLFFFFFVSTYLKRKADKRNKKVVDKLWIIWILKFISGLLKFLIVAIFVTFWTIYYIDSLFFLQVLSIITILLLILDLACQIAILVLRVIGLIQIISQQTKGENFETRGYGNEQIPPRPSGYPQNGFDNRYQDRQYPNRGVVQPVNNYPVSNIPTTERVISPRTNQGPLMTEGV